MIDIYGSMVIDWCIVLMCTNNNYNVSNCLVLLVTVF